MKKRFNIDDYKGKYVMHCDTEEKAKIFCDYLDVMGKKWWRGASYTTHTNWELNRKKHCFDFNGGLS